MARYVMVEASKDPRDRGHGPGAWTTEWSAAMDERRGEQPGAESGPAVPRQIAAAGSRLSPVQEAYGRYARHFNTCPACRDIDRSCDDGATLWRAYEATSSRASEQLAGDTP